MIWRTFYIFACKIPTCMVSACKIGLSSLDLLKDANMITITEFINIELADEV